MNNIFRITRWADSISALFLIIAFSTNFALAQDKIKVGVSTALSGEAAPFGMDIKNALTLANEKFGGGRYEFIFEDERCDNRAAVAVANKLINIDKIKYALGFPCNASLLASAPIYDRAGILVVTSSGNSGDVLDIGKTIFRLFPSDAAGAAQLYHYMAARHKKIAVLTEQNEYPALMERTVRKVNSESKAPLEIFFEEFRHGETDIRSLLLKLKSKGAEAFFVNANTDTSFIPVVKQIRQINFSGALYSVYLPASAVALKELGSALNGFIFSNLPLSDDLVTAKGKEVLKEFRTRFGEPQSGFPVVPTTLESFRVFNLALQSGSDPVEYLAKTKFSDGILPEFYFDQHGAVQGIKFQMQKIENGKVVVIAE